MILVDLYTPPPIIIEPYPIVVEQYYIPQPQYYYVPYPVFEYKQQIQIGNDVIIIDKRIERVLDY